MRVLDRIVDAVMVLLLVALVAVSFTAVVFRYALDSALSWSFEASLILLTYLTFVGCFAALRQGAHLKVDVLTAALPLPLRGVAFVVAQAIVLTVSVVMVVWGTEQTLQFAGTSTTMLDAPRGPIYGIIPVSGAAMAAETVASLVRGLRRLARGEPPERVDTDPAHEL